MLKSSDMDYFYFVHFKKSKLILNTLLNFDINAIKVCVNEIDLSYDYKCYNIL